MASEEQYGNENERLQRDVIRIVDAAQKEGVDISRHRGTIEDIVIDVRNLRDNLKTTKERNATAKAVAEEASRILRESGS